MNDGQQRALLGRYLRENEAAVPPTTARILQALREEEQPSSSQSPKQKRSQYMLPEPFASSSADDRDDYLADDIHFTRTTDPLMLSHGPALRWLRTAVALATVAALIFTALSIVGHYIYRPASALSGLQTQVATSNPRVMGSKLASPASRDMPASPATTVSPATTEDVSHGWNGLVLIIGFSAFYSVISTYNYLNGDHRDLAESSASMRFDGVASYGRNMLYQVVIDGHTLYYTLHPLPTTGFFYQLAEKDAINAIWMPDNLHALIATRDSGVILVDTQTGEPRPFLPGLKTSGLKFYHDDYLYYLGGTASTANTLFRINVISGVARQVTGHSRDGDFWLSPDGMTIYYKNGDPTGRDDIYAAGSDGTSSQFVRPDDQPIGYAPDNSLVVMRHVDQTFEAVQLGATPLQDRVLFPDVAPGASSLCDPSHIRQAMCDTSNIALAPYSHALVVIASYPDGSRKVWSDDISSGKQFVMMTPIDGESVIVPGWDRLAA